MYFLCKAQDREITNRKHKNEKKQSLNRLLKGHLFVSKSWNKKAASPFSAPAGNMHELYEKLKFFATLLMTANDHKNTMSIGLGVTNKFQQVGEICKYRIHE